MEITKLTSTVIIAFIASVFAIETTAQVNNRLPRKAIIGAMNNALRDTTVSSVKPFVCKPNTMAITIDVKNASLPEEHPYLITADSLGITLEIFRGDEHVFNEFYQYRGSNFAKIMAKVKSAKLKKVKAHGESIDGGNTTVLSFLNNKGAYFSLSDRSGLMNYEGDFDGVITEITHQIPNFQAIICKDYIKPITLKDGQVKLDDNDVLFVVLTEVSNILSVGCDTEIKTHICVGPQIELNLIWKESDNRSVKLVPAKQYKPQNVETMFWGVSYEDIVKNEIPATEFATYDGVVKAKYSFEPEKGKVYILYDSTNNTAYPFKIIESSEDGAVE
jgi:hypothetical protein